MYPNTEAATAPVRESTRPRSLNATAIQVVDPVKFEGLLYY